MGTRTTVTAAGFLAFFDGDEEDGDEEDVTFGGGRGAPWEALVEEWRGATGCDGGAVGVRLLLLIERCSWLPF